MTTEFAPQDADTVRCNNCGTSLAPDQRYCVNCGERRGSTRFSSAMFAVAEAPAAAPSAPPRGSGPSRLFSGSGFTLVAFVATLLVAVGLGVLIGHDSSSNSSAPRAVASQPPVNVTVNGGGSGVAGTSGSTSSSSTGSATKSSGKTFKIKKVTAKVAAKAAAKGTAAANKTLGGGGTKLAPPTAKTGSKCSSGAGCAGGKFTGNFFGGG
jgi:hypothetical protein